MEHACIDCGRVTYQCPMAGMRCRDCADEAVRAWKRAKVEAERKPKRQQKRDRSGA